MAQKRRRRQGDPRNLDDNLEGQQMVTSSDKSTRTEITRKEIPTMIKLNCSLNSAQMPTAQLRENGVPKPFLEAMQKIDFRATDAIITEADLETNGRQGGDSGHGSYSTIRFKDFVSIGRAEISDNGDLEIRVQGDAEGRNVFALMAQIGKHGLDIHCR